MFFLYGIQLMSIQFGLDFTARHGEITDVDHLKYGKADLSTVLNSTIASLKGLKIHEIEDWVHVLPQASDPSGSPLPSRETHPGTVMNDLFGGNGSHIRE